MEMAKVTSKGQITIPVSIRRKLHIKEGDKLLFIDNPGGVVMVNPDMLQGGQAAPEPLQYYETNNEAEPEMPFSVNGVDGIEVSSDSTMFTSESVANKEDNSNDSVSQSSDNNIVSHNATISSPEQSSDKPGTSVKGVDIGALLDEIRSIGSKI